MLSAFLSKSALESYRSIFSDQQSDRLDNIILLSHQAFETVAKGEVYLKAQSWSNHLDTTREQTVRYVSPLNIYSDATDSSII